MSKVFVTPMGGAEENFLAYMFPESKVVELTGIEPWGGYAYRIAVSGAEVREKLALLANDETAGYATIVAMASALETLSSGVRRYMYLKTFKIRFNPSTGELVSASENYSASKYPYEHVVAEAANNVAPAGGASTSSGSTKYDKENDEIILHVSNYQNSVLLANVNSSRFKAFLISQPQDISL